MSSQGNGVVAWTCVVSDLDGGAAVAGGDEQSVRATGRATPAQAWVAVSDAVLGLLYRHPHARTVLATVGDEPPARIYPGVRIDGELDLPATAQLLAALVGAAADSASSRLAGGH